ncbi:MAG: peptide chain release factor N(5)-glutamine methyltransferase [Clostridia bacterium]|nr:peptide chain release factor N(5)-glutamine methyltransferase [Clostridia bacterium]
MGVSKPNPQLLDVLKLAADFLGARGVESPRLDAEVLLARILGMDRIRLYVEYDRPLALSELSRYREEIAKRASRVPVAYITGVKEFMSVEFQVDGRVLIPGPDTEILVEATRDEIADAGMSAPRIADIGTGSGAIACALAKILPGARILATDISRDALEVAAQNVSRLGLEQQVVLGSGDLFQALAAPEWERVDVIVSNPPYIPSGDIPGLQPEISKYEPRLALDGGPDGLELYRRIAAGAAAHLEPGGIVALEAGDGQAARIAELLADSGLRDISLRQDYSGVDRVIIGRTARNSNGDE